MFFILICRNFLLILTFFTFTFFLFLKALFILSYFMYPVNHFSLFFYGIFFYGFCYTNLGDTMKKVFITGAGSGLGKEAAICLAKRGHIVYCRRTL